MIAFICLFFPAVLTVWLYEHLRQTELSRKQWLYRYCINTLFVNLACFAAKRLLLGTADAPFVNLYTDVTPAAALNYLGLAIPAAVVLAFVQVLLSKHANITVEDDKHDQNKV